MKNLNGFENKLTNLLKGEFTDDFDIALNATITGKKLTPALFYDLLSAFKQDVTKKRYNNFEEMLNYSRRSANPVGRLILELFNIRDEKAFLYSDNICSALQFINFIQDTKIDFEKGRIYIPLDEMKMFNVSENLFESAGNNSNFTALIKYQVDRIEKMFFTGKNLLKYLNGRLKFEISWTLLGGLEILAKVKRIDYNVIAERPMLNKKDFFFLLCKAMVLK